jgi:two-component system LytT family response regulator
MRVLVIDDEAPARQRITDLLRRVDGLEAIQECGDGRSGVEAIRTRNPDLLFLDVQMPELDGLAVVEEIGPARMPLTIFVTAYERHAIAAFEANALDYLLKPFSDERFHSALARARARLADRRLLDFGERVQQLLSPVPSSLKLERIVVKAAGVTRFLPVSEIEWIEGAGVYVTLHTANKGILYRSTLNDLESRLDSSRFVRIHRSAIVNIAKVSHLEPISHGEFEVVMKSGARPKLSRTYRPRLETLLGQSL